MCLCVVAQVLSRSGERAGAGLVAAPPPAVIPPSGEGIGVAAHPSGPIKMTAAIISREKAEPLKYLSIPT